MRIVNLAVLSLLAAACRTGSDSFEHPTDPDELVFLVERVGGFLPIQAHLFEPALFAVFGDGTIVRQSPRPEIYPGPALVGFEKRYEDRVREALGLPVPWDPVWTRVAKYDSMILHRELRVFRAPELLPRWYDPEAESQVPAQVRPISLDWREARAMFRARMHDLGWGLGGNL